MLAACARGAVDLHFNVFRADFHVHLFHLWQHCHSGGGGVDPAAGFGLRDPLDPVDAAFIFHPGPGAPAVDQKIRFFDAAQLGVVVVEQLHSPAPGGGIHGVHAKQTVGKEGAFFAPYAAADFHNDVFFIVGILGQQQELEFLLQLSFRLFGGLKLLLAELLHLRVGLPGQQLPGLLLVLLGLPEGGISFYNGFQFVFFLQ